MEENYAYTLRERESQLKQKNEIIAKVNCEEAKQQNLNDQFVNIEAQTNEQANFDGYLIDSMLNEAEKQMVRDESTRRFQNLEVQMRWERDSPSEKSS